MGGRASVIMVLGFAAIFAMIQYRLGEVGTEATENMVAYHEQMARHNVAVAGANLGLSMVFQNPALRGVLASDLPYYSGTFSAQFDSVAADTFLLTATGTYQGKDHTVKVYMTYIKRLFTQATDTEPVREYITGDTIRGKVHTNDNILINGSPFFRDRVTTAKNFSPPPGKGTNSGVYQGGYATGVPPFEFHYLLGKEEAFLHADPLWGELKTQAAASGFDGATVNPQLASLGKLEDSFSVVFDPGTPASGDGMAYIYSAEGDGSIGVLLDSVDINDPSFNGMIFSHHEIHAYGGVIDGNVTLISEHLHIMDDLTYEQNPLTGTSDDMLGIFTPVEIKITDYKGIMNGKTLEIHANIFAGEFRDVNYTTRVPGTIKLLGTLMEKNAGNIRTLKTQGGSKVVDTGWYKDFTMDDRLLDPAFQPKGMPEYTFKTLGIASWWE